MIRALVLIGLLGSCIKGRQPASPRPTSYGSSSGTQVYRTTATGGAVSGPSAAGGDARDDKAGPRHNELLRAGLITLAASYAGTVVVGQVVQATLIGEFETAVGAKETLSRLWLPVIGPWDALIYNESEVRSQCDAIAGVAPWEFYDCALMTESSIAIGVGAVAQTAGFVMTLAGLLRTPKASTPKRHDSRLVITPHGNATGAGVLIHGAF